MTNAAGGHAWSSTTASASSFRCASRPGRKDRPDLMVALDRINATRAQGRVDHAAWARAGAARPPCCGSPRGSLRPDEGRITIDGTPVDGARARTRAWCSRISACCRGAPSWATSSFRSRSTACGAAERRDLARHFIELVGLGAFAEHFPHELSGGMQQRVGIARALMRKPILIFMDEPFGALDAQTREQLQEDFLAIWSRTGATVIFVTHSIDEALILSDRIFMFNTAPGRIRTHCRLSARRRAPRRRRAHASRFRKMPRRIARHAQERIMTSSQNTLPRQSVSAPQPTLAQRLRDGLFSPNAIRTASVAVFFVIWEYYGRRMDPIFMAPPSAIFEAAVQLMQSGALKKALIQTLWPFSVGMALTVVVGITLGIVMAQWRTLEYVLDPFINALYAIPRIALIPLIILWAGLEFVGKVTHPGLGRDLPHHRQHLCRHPRRARRDAGDRPRLWRDRVADFLEDRPAGGDALHHGGIRLAVGLAIIGIIVAEFFTAISGLGGMIVEYANVFATAKLFVPIIVIALVGVVLTEFVMWLERRMSRWRQLERERF